jgi:hypothetical protein
LVKAYLLKFTILNQVNGQNSNRFPGLDIQVGQWTPMFMSTEDLNMIPLIFQLML